MSHSYYLIIAFCCLFSYLAGSIPFGLLLGKWFGPGDIRTMGSGNIGATNMLRTGGKKLGIATLALDFSKGIIGVGIAQGMCNYIFTTQMGDFTIAPSIVCFAGLSAVLGHVFPIWLKFKGGKGVATTLGVFFATAPLIGFVTVMGWGMMFYLTRISSLAALASLTVAPVLGYMYASHDFAYMTIVLLVIVVAKHKDNIDRLRAGTENKMEKKHDPS